MSPGKSGPETSFLRSKQGEEHVFMVYKSQGSKGHFDCPGVGMLHARNSYMYVCMYMYVAHVCKFM